VVSERRRSRAVGASSSNSVTSTLGTARAGPIKVWKNPMDDDTRERWLSKLAKLKIDMKGNPAPHKPLLLLVVIELAEQGLLPKGTVPLTPELAFRFCTYWTIVAHRRSQKPDVRFPFHHMQSGGFWTALAEDGSPSPHRSLTRFAALDQDFEECLDDRAFREEARRVLLCKYFPPDERVALCSLLELPVPSDDEAASALMHKSPEEAEQKGREARFRLKVVSLYNYTCALTGYRLMTIASGSIVDAAHIHQFSDPRNNDIRNGIALCKNAHWLFDVDSGTGNATAFGAVSAGFGYSGGECRNRSFSGVDRSTGSRRSKRGRRAWGVKPRVAKQFPI
jgi:putative restriction endonuclease